MNGTPRRMSWWMVGLALVRVAAAVVILGWIAALLSREF
jgi:hypothetical protein